MKLQGYRVVDLSVFLPGPYLSLMLADHGAEVIKVEMPGEGDPVRHIGVVEDDQSVLFRNLNRGKKSVALDLKSATGRATLLALCDSADVFIEAFRPGVAERLGLGYEQLRARNPGLVYCSISAFGQVSPYRARPAHELAVEAMSGALSVTLGQDDKPAMPGLPFADLLSGLHGLSGVLMALLRREKTGTGDFIDLSMLDSMVSACVYSVGPVLAEGRQPNPKHERTTGGGAFYRLYQTSDGKYIALAGQEPKFVHALLNDLGRADLAPLCLQGPGPHQQPVVDFLQSVFLQKTRNEWEQKLTSLDMCFGPVYDFVEAFADDNMTVRKMLVKDAAGRANVGNPINFQNEPALLDLQAPTLGQHNSEFSGDKN